MNSKRLVFVLLIVFAIMGLANVAQASKGLVVSWNCPAGWTRWGHEGVKDVDWGCIPPPEPTTPAPTEPPSTEEPTQEPTEEPTHEPTPEPTPIEEPSVTPPARRVTPAAQHEPVDDIYTCVTADGVEHIFNTKGMPPGSGKFESGGVEYRVTESRTCVAIQPITVIPTEAPFIPMECVEDEALVPEIHPQDGSDVDLFRIDLGDNGQVVNTVNLTSLLEGNALNPSISPNGCEVVFSNRGDLWVVGLGGGQPRNVTETEDVTEVQPEWASDWLIHYTVEETGIIHTTDKWYTFNWDTETVGSLVESSPDGRYLVFTNANGNITFSNARAPWQPIATAELGNNPVWSPDGTRVSFDNTDGFHYIDFTTSDVAQLQPLQVASLQDQAPPVITDGAEDTDGSGRAAFVADSQLWFTPNVMQPELMILIVADELAEATEQYPDWFDPNAVEFNMQPFQQYLNALRNA